jgi:divinyl protochlorophyllide a 8-vinyl-reductase
VPVALTDSASATPSSRIGPNAILQYLPVLEERFGAERLAALLQEAAIARVPDGTAMVDEAKVARLHQAIRRFWPDAAPMLARRAGAGTADYIVANRIPPPARWLLPRLPASLAERLLARAVRSHAWTFAGSGQFAVASSDPLVFTIRDNPIVRHERSASPVCDWHAAVFERLFGRLVAADYTVTETQCAACGAPACTFELHRHPFCTSVSPSHGR